MKNIFLSLLLCLPLLAISQTKRVLFIGNSYTAYNNLPDLVKSVALSLGDTMIVDSHTPGGYTFNQHSTNATTLSKISQGNWDFVVLQAQSQEPSFPPAQVQAQTYPYAKNLCDSIRAYNPCTEPVFYMTWGRKNGDAANCAVYPVICTYEGMQLRLRQSYLEMGDLNNATVSPVGVAWKKIRDTYPTIELYNPDESHPSLWGSYLAACVFYSTLYNKNCQGAFVPASLNTDTALMIQQVASAMVLDSLPKWYLGNLQSQSFSVNITGYTVAFTDHSINAGSVFWDFGDGTGDTGDQVQHTYTDSGWYIISQTISNACFTSTQYGEVYIPYSQPSGKINPTASVMLNIADHHIIIHANQKLERITITDLMGRQRMFNIQNTQWQSEPLQQGLYLIQVQLQDGQVISRKVIIAD